MLVSAAVQRFWTDQRERFPFFGNGLVIASFSVSAIAFSALARGQSHLPGGAILIAGFVSSFLMFLMLRLAKLGVTTRTRAVAAALRGGLVLEPNGTRSAAL